MQHPSLDGFTIHFFATPWLTGEAVVINYVAIDKRSHKKEEEHDSMLLEGAQTLAMTAG
jgi:hypothetical protein